MSRHHAVEEEPVAGWRSVRIRMRLQRVEEAAMPVLQARCPHRGRGEEGQRGMSLLEHPGGERHAGLVMVREHGADRDAVQRAIDEHDREAVQQEPDKRLVVELAMHREDDDAVHAVPVPALDDRRFGGDTAARAGDDQLVPELLAALVDAVEHSDAKEVGKLGYHEADPSRPGGSGLAPLGLDRGHSRRDERAPAPIAHDPAAFEQVLHCPLDRDAAHAEALGELHLGRQAIAFRKVAGADLAFYPVDDIVIEKRHVWYAPVHTTIRRGSTALRVSHGWAGCRKPAFRPQAADGPSIGRYAPRATRTCSARWSRSRTSGSSSAMPVISAMRSSR